MAVHSLEPRLTDAQIGYYACNAPSGPTALLQNALKASCLWHRQCSTICVPSDEASE